MIYGGTVFGALGAASWEEQEGFVYNDNSVQNMEPYALGGDAPNLPAWSQQQQPSSYDAGMAAPSYDGGITGWQYDASASGQIATFMDPGLYCAAPGW